MSAPRRALVLVDVQQEYFDGPLNIEYPPREESLARILQSLDVAERAQTPVVVVQHEYPAGAPAFVAGTPGYELQPDVKARTGNAAKHVTKSLASVFAGTDLTDWLRANDIDTVTLVGYMTNNCVLGSAADAERLGFSIEVLSDATGAIHMSNEAGSVDARQVHETLMVLLHSNWAAVAATGAWAEAVSGGQELPKSDLVTTAAKGRADH